MKYKKYSKLKNGDKFLIYVEGNHTIPLWATMISKHSDTIGLHSDIRGWELDGYPNISKTLTRGWHTSESTYYDAMNAHFNNRDLIPGEYYTLEV